MGQPQQEQGKEDDDLLFLEILKGCQAYQSKRACQSQELSRGFLNLTRASRHERVNVSVLQVDSTKAFTSDVVLRMEEDEKPTNVGHMEAKITLMMCQKEEEETIQPLRKQEDGGVTTSSSHPLRQRFTKVSTKTRTLCDQATSQTSRRGKRDYGNIVEASQSALNRFATLPSQELRKTQVDFIQGR